MRFEWEIKYGKVTLEKLNDNQWKFHSFDKEGKPYNRIVNRKMAERFLNSQLKLA